MFEHNQDGEESLANMTRLLKSGGMLLITCAGYGRHEHGTTRTSPQDAPFTNDFYENRHADFFCAMVPDLLFSEYEISKKDSDIRFWGIKR